VAVRLVYTTQFRAYLDSIDDRVALALEIMGGIVESHAKEYCPVDTGRLRNSIRHGLSPSKENTELIGSNVEYAPYVELGHAQRPGRYVPAIGRRLVASHVAARPYLRPALENHRQELEAVLERVFAMEPLEEGTIPRRYDEEPEPLPPEHPEQPAPGGQEPDGEGPWIVID